MSSAHLIIGAGDVGKSIYRVVDQVAEAKIRDKDSEIEGEFGFLHICFGYFEGFIEAVCEYAKAYQPHTIIIHSTVPPGTIRKLGETAIHIPVRGKHPNLSPAMQTFRLYIGGNDPSAIERGAEFFRKINPDVVTLEQYPPESTEILKLMDTSYYAWNILFEKEMHRICQEYQIPFEVVYQDANRTYNSGYVKLGHPEFTRPVLDHMPGPIGGHCLTPNAEIFPDTYINQLILKKNQEFTQDKK